MIFEWNQAFESYPPGSFRGNTMGEALRRLKQAFYERFIVEHSITEGVSPTVLHRVGECSVLQILANEDTAVSNYLAGGIVYKRPALFWDDGSNLISVIPVDHGTFVGLADDDHPQYVHVSGETLTTLLAVDAVTALPTSGDQFTSAYPDRVLSINGHLATDVDGLSYHDDGVIGEAELAGVTLTLNGGKWNILSYSQAKNSGDTGNLISGGAEAATTVPRVSSVSSSGSGYLLFYGGSDTLILAYEVGDMDATVSYKYLGVGDS